MSESVDCIFYHLPGVPATGRVRRAGELGRPEHVSDPMCDACQVAVCTSWRSAGHRGVGAVPLDYQKRAGKARPGRVTDGMVEAFISTAYAGNPASLDAIRAGLVAALTRRELERRTEPELHPINLDPYPGTVGEVADEIVRYVLELESGPARGLVDEVFSRLVDWRSSRDDGIAEHASNAVDPADFY